MAFTLDSVSGRLGRSIGFGLLVGYTAIDSTGDGSAQPAWGWMGLGLLFAVAGLALLARSYWKEKPLSDLGEVFVEIGVQAAGGGVVAAAIYALAAGAGTASVETASVAGGIAAGAAGYAFGSVMHRVRRSRGEPAR